MPHENRALRTTFDQAALLYDEARPKYPEQLFDDLVAFSAIPKDGRILEIGCGTGQATVPFAQRSYRMLCVELGANMAAVARKNVADYPQVEIINMAFEDWPVEQTAFDIAFSASAFHWIDPAFSYQKIAQALKPGGTIAIFWHVHVESKASEGFFKQMQPIYQREAPGLVKDDFMLPWPEEVQEPFKAEFERTGLFREITVRRYPWETSYDAESYIRLLSTYSDHLAQDPQQRERLFRGIADLINTRLHGHLHKGYLTMLYMAKKA